MGTKKKAILLSTSLFLLTSSVSIQLISCKIDQKIDIKHQNKSQKLKELSIWVTKLNDINWNLLDKTTAVKFKKISNDLLESYTNFSYLKSEKSFDDYYQIVNNFKQEVEKKFDLNLNKINQNQKSIQEIKEPILDKDILNNNFDIDNLIQTNYYPDFDNIVIKISKNEKDLTKKLPKKILVTFAKRNVLLPVEWNNLIIKKRTSTNMFSEVEGKFIFNNKEYKVKTIFNVYDEIEKDPNIKWSIIDDSINAVSLDKEEYKTNLIFNNEKQVFEITNSDEKYNLNNIENKIKIKFNNPNINYSISLLSETFTNQKIKTLISKEFVIKTFNENNFLLNKYILIIKKNNIENINSNIKINLKNLDINQYSAKKIILKSFFDRVNHFNYKAKNTYKILSNIHKKLTYEKLNEFDNNKIIEIDHLILNAEFLIENFKDFNFENEYKNNLKNEIIEKIKNNILEYSKLNELKKNINDFENLIKNDPSINDFKEIFKNKIRNENLLSDNDKKILIDGLEKSYFLISDIYLKLTNLKIETKLKINEIKNKILTNTFIGNPLKSYLLLKINLIDNYEKLDLISQEINQILNNANSIINIINKSFEEIKNNKIGGNKANILYKLLVKYKNIYSRKSSLILSNENLDLFLFELKNWLILENDNEPNVSIFNKEVEKVFDPTRIKNENIERWRNLDLERFMNIASLNSQTSNIMLKDLDTDFLDFEIENIKFSNDKSASVITYKITHKFNPNLNSTRELSIELPNDNIIPKIKAIEQSKNLDSYFNIDYHSLSKMSYNEFKSNFNLQKTNEILGIQFYANFDLQTITKKTKYIHESFEYKIKNIPRYENSRLYATVSFLFNGNVFFEKELESEKNIVFQNNFATQSDDDVIDLEKAKSIVNNRDLILTNLYLKKDSKITHQDIYPEEILTKLPELYDLPTFGKYRVAPKKILESLDYEEAKWGGIARTIWAVQEKITNENGKVDWKWVENTESEVIHNIDHFKRYQYYDFIKPKNNEFLTSLDFENNNTFDLDLKKQIDLLNESDLDFRKVIGKAENENSFTLYRNLNPRELIAQKAFLKMNYFLKIKDNKEKQNNDNLKIANIIAQEGHYVNSNLGYIPKNTLASSADNNLIKNSTFYYFYDIKETKNNTITFKLGFVSNRDRNKRYSPNKIFTLHNIVNDFEQNLYPEVMLNNITYENLKIDTNTLSTKTVNEWKNNLDLINNHILLINSKNNKDLEIDSNFISYKNFKLDKNYFKVGEIKQWDTNKAFIRFEVLNYENKWVLGKNWYLISNFKDDNSLFEDPSWLKEDKLKTIYFDNKEVWRQREIEPFIEDAEWSLKSANEAIWKMNNKYLKHTLLSPNAKLRTIDLELYAGMLVFDSQKNDRIINPNKTIKINLDFDKVLLSPLTYKSSFNEVIDSKNIRIDYTLTIYFDKNDNSLNFSFLTKSPFKIKLGYPWNQRQENNEKFDSERAILIPYAPLKMSMSYINHIQNESDFGLGKTNLYDYNKAGTSASGQVHLLYNDASYYAKKIYNPNQNVYWKHNDGFIPNIQWIRDEWGTTNRDWNLINRVRDNSIKYSTYNRHPGSGGILSKINDDPSNLNIYYTSNWHVGEFFPNIEANDNGIYGKNRKEPPTIGNPVMSLPLNKWDSDLYRGYEYKTSEWWSLLSSLQMSPNETKVIYVGWNKENNIGKSVEELVNKDGKKSSATYDFQIVHSNFETSIDHAKKGFRDDIINYLKNQLEAKPIRMDQSSDKNYQIVPVLNPLAHIGFPGWGFMSGYVNFRPENTKETFKIYQYPNYSPILIGNGNSGSAIFSRDGEYTAVWRSGAKGAFSNGQFFDNDKNNFFGINWNNENPLDSKSFKNSVGHMILRQALNHPFKYQIPWFYKKINSK
ncbi:MGA_1079 family surface serine endopeptidase [Metamycoplasma canadense]|nr:hypothetical protein [Metamycoplasma canadense]